MFKWLPRITGQKLILPLYHVVCPDAPVHIKPLYKVRTSKQFETDLDFLLKHYNPIDITQLHSHLNENVPLKGNNFLLSFDGGLREFKDYAWPILKRKGVPATLFVNSGFVDNKSLFFRFKAALLLNFLKENSHSKAVLEAAEVFKGIIETVANLEQFVMQIPYAQQSFLDNLAEYLGVDFNVFLQNQKPYLSLDELKILQAEGVYIGAHSVNHPLFNQLSDIEKTDQLTQSVNWVSQNFNQPVRAFSYPFTDFGLSGEFMDSVFASEKSLAEITFGTAGMKRKKYSAHLQRIPIEDYDLQMDQILQKQYLNFLAKAPLFKNTMVRR